MRIICIPLFQFRHFSYKFFSKTLEAFILLKIPIHGSLLDATPHFIHPWKYIDLLKKGSPAHSIFSEMCKSALILRYKVFSWLLLTGRLNIRNLLERKTFILPNYTCVLYNNKVHETILHLFWDCPFSLSCWDSICQKGNIGFSMIEESVLAMKSLPHLRILLSILLLWDVGAFGLQQMIRFSRELDHL